jgi:hypothetical protein
MGLQWSEGVTAWYAWSVDKLENQVDACDTEHSTEKPGAVRRRTLSDPLAVYNEVHSFSFSERHNSATTRSKPARGSRYTTQTTRGNSAPLKTNVR